MSWARGPGWMKMETYEKAEWVPAFPSPDMLQWEQAASHLPPEQRALPTPMPSLLCPDRLYSLNQDPKQSLSPLSASLLGVWSQQWERKLKQIHQEETKQQKKKEALLRDNRKEKTTYHMLNSYRWKQGSGEICQSVKYRVWMSESTYQS